MRLKWNYGSAQVNGRNLGQVHGSQSGVDTAVDADEEAAGDEHFVRIGQHRASFQRRRDDGEYVVHQQTSLPAIRYTHAPTLLNTTLLAFINTRTRPFTY